MNDFRRWLWDLLYPPRCMLCHRLMDTSEQLLCGRCHGDPERYHPPRTVEFFEKAVISFCYEGDLRRSIHRFKFSGMQSYAQGYARWMVPDIERELEGTYDLVSWVPCSRLRRWLRGYDQAQVLAKEIALHLGASCVCTLKKVRHTPKQSQQLDAARRRANVLDAYEAYEPERFSGKRILLIDDVMTTGATLSECAKVLRLAGASKLVCAVIAARRKT